jgi:hypothetical protein
MGQKKMKNKKMSRTKYGVAWLSSEKTKSEKCHEHHMVWPWLSSAKKRSKEKCHACHLVWPYLPMGKFFREKQKTYEDYKTFCTLCLCF